MCDAAAASNFVFRFATSRKRFHLDVARDVRAQTNVEKRSRGESLGLLTNLLGGACLGDLFRPLSPTPLSGL